jgi:GR25 family glycosyltransferase involved in LPS biosynthesis
MFDNIKKAIKKSPNKFGMVLKDTEPDVYTPIVVPEPEILGKGTRTPTSNMNMIYKDKTPDTEVPEPEPVPEIEILNKNLRSVPQMAMLFPDKNDTPPSEETIPLIRLSDYLTPMNVPNPMEGISNIYYINLDRCTDRKNYMEKMFQDPMFQGIEIERVEGMDGKTERMEDFLDFHLCQKHPRMVNSEFACTISHFRAIHQFAMTDDPIAMIVEDDLSVEFVPYWKETMGELIRGAPPDWEILQLSYILFSHYHTQKYDPWEMSKNYCGTAAYLITNDAAKRLTAYLCRFSSPAMPKYCIGAEHPYYHQADRFLYCFFKTYSINCAPFTPKDNNDSLIHEEHMGHHVLSKEKTKKMYLGWPVG